MPYTQRPQVTLEGTTSEALAALVGGSSAPWGLHGGWSSDVIEILVDRVRCGMISVWTSKWICPSFQSSRRSKSRYPRPARRAGGTACGRIDSIEVTQSLDDEMQLLHVWHSGTVWIIP